MKTLAINRRQLLKLGISSGVLATLPLGCLRVDDEISATLDGFVGDSDLPLDPGRTGVMSEDQFETLAGLCRYVDRGWDLAVDFDEYLLRLRSDLNLKTEYEPSYLTEYGSAAELVNLLGASTSSVDEVWSILLFSELPVESESGTKLGRARRFVFSEIITHLVAVSGAFKSFGLVNYRGYFGGAYSEPRSYRRGSR